ncbi:MAG: hypothetical protein ACR2HH_06515 [Chthoniobacterales bacterium]
MIPVWFQRLNQRERTLLLGVGGVVFLLLNLFIWTSLFGMIRGAREDFVNRQAARKEQIVFVHERKIWEHRSEWMKKNQPALKSPGEASTLLEQVKQVAGKHNLLIENPAIGSGESTPNYQAVFATIETKSPWPPLVQFLYDVQKPESFVVFESVNLAIDSADPTMMRGKFKVARWFAPKP